MQLVPFVLLIFICSCQAFFKNSPFQLSTITNRLNLTCASDFDESGVLTGCEYCVYEFFTNGTDYTIWHDCIYITNSYRLVARRCTGFTEASDVGFGICSPLPFELFDMNILCICASNMCNENFTACQQSVNANSSLSPLQSPIPVLSTAISCVDTPLSIFNSTYYCVRDSSPYINMTQCIEYVYNHTVLCMYLASDEGNYLTLVALPDEDYEYVLSNQIQTMEDVAADPTAMQYYNETASAFFSYWQGTFQDPDNTTHIYTRCYCTTNNCNTNLTSCLKAAVPNSAAVINPVISTLVIWLVSIVYMSINEFF